MRNYIFVLLLVLGSEMYIAQSGCIDKCIDSIGNISECELCKDIVNIAIREVKKGNKTYHDLVKIIEDLCDIIGGPIISKECKFFLNNLNKIEKMIISGYNSTYICDFFHMCNTTDVSQQGLTRRQHIMA
mgnify:FL=1